MKSFIILISIILLISILLLFALGKYSQTRPAPGLVSGSLSKCSATPNCVCSEYIEDISHYIKPIQHAQDDELTRISIASATIRAIGGTIHHETDEYITATFTSPLFGFVDDLEIRNDETLGILHIRSSSRVGYSDGGINRERIEIFKKNYHQKIVKSTSE